MQSNYWDRMIEKLAPYVLLVCPVEVTDGNVF